MSDVLAKMQGENIGQAAQRLYIPESIAERLRRQKRQHEEALERINAALSALEANPGFADAFDAITKAL